MTTLVGLDLRGRRVLVVGGGPVGLRRTRGLVVDGAKVRLVDPYPSEDARAFATSMAGAGGVAPGEGSPGEGEPNGSVEIVERGVVEGDLDDVWLVVTATGDPTVDEQVVAWAAERRVFCVDASDGSASTARFAATSTQAGLTLGVVSTGDPDPRRSAAVRDDLALRVASGVVDLRRRRPGPGRVVLIGSGPGDPALVTLAGLEALAAADVVVTDRLGATDLLERLPDDVEVVDVGKTPTRHPVPQEEINAILVERARRGQVVVRLKGGDPFVYGRGGEEVHACRTAGVEVSVVPGVSSALAVPALAGIPVTQRGVATAVHVGSGHAGPDAAMLAALDSGATVVLLMAVSTLPAICEAALAAGVDPDLPLATVERGSTAAQRVTRATVATAAEVVARAGVRAPAVVVIGRVAAEGFLDDPVAATSGVLPTSEPPAAATVEPAPGPAPRADTERGSVSPPAPTSRSADLLAPDGSA